MNKLEIVIRTAHIYEAGGDTRIVDFMIDGFSVADRVREIWPPPPPPSPAAPFGYRGFDLIGVTEWRALLDSDMFLSGTHPDFTGVYSGMLPLLVCSDCGMAWCSAIWTRLVLNEECILWEGLGFVDERSGWTPLAESPTFRFSPDQYRQVFVSAIETARLAETQKSPE